MTWCDAMGRGRRLCDSKEGGLLLDWEFLFWIPISGRGRIWNSASNLGIPKIFRGKKIRKFKTILSEKLEFHFWFQNSGNCIHRNLVLMFSQHATHTTPLGTICHWHHSTMVPSPLVPPSIRILRKKHSPTTSYASARSLKPGMFACYYYFQRFISCKSDTWVSLSTCNSGLTFLSKFEISSKLQRSMQLFERVTFSISWNISRTT